MDGMKVILLSRAGGTTAVFLRATPFRRTRNECPSYLQQAVRVTIASSDREVVHGSIWPTLLSVGRQSASRTMINHNRK